MVSAFDDNSRLPGIPALPPIVGVAAGNNESASPRSSPPQRSPLCNTTPPSSITTRSCGVTTISSLSSPDAGGATTSSSPRRSPRKRTLDHLGLSLAKPLSDFSKRKSDNDSVVSGDDSNKWEEEKAWVMDVLGLQLATDAAADNAFFDDEGEERLREVLEWEFLTEEAVEELAAEELGADETPPPPAVTPTIVIVVEFKKKSMRELKDIAALVNVAQGGTKRALFDRIATSGSGVERVDENTFKYSRPAVEGEMGDVGEVIKPPLWVELQCNPSCQLMALTWLLVLRSGSTARRTKRMQREGYVTIISLGRRSTIAISTERFLAPPTLLPAMTATLLLRQRS